MENPIDVNMLYSGKKTLGEIATERLKAHSNEVIYIQDIAHEICKPLGERILESLNEFKKSYPHWEKNLYVQVLREQLQTHRNVGRWHKPIIRLSPPTPSPNQIVYQYIYTTDDLIELWVLPPQYAIDIYIENKDTIDPSEWKLLKYCIDYVEGDLDRLVMKINGEIQDIEDGKVIMIEK